MFSLEVAIKKLISDAIVDAYDRIKDGETEIQPADGKPEVVEPVQEGGRRKRRTKAEIEADMLKEEEAAKAPVKEPVKPVTLVIPYDVLKEVVLSYVLENGKPAAEKILGQFGVSKAQDLKPEQYSEAYDLFQAAIAEGDEEIA